MVTKQTIKDIHALSQKKHRDARRLFVAEGPKVVADLLPLMECECLYATSDFLSKQPPVLLQRVKQLEEVDAKTIDRLSLLCTPRDVLALFRKPEAAPFDQLKQLPQKNLCLALDGVQDPGNMGTIVRIADWFGIEHIFASHATADVFSPKVVQATMGAVGRVQVHYLDLLQYIEGLSVDVPVFGTFLDGDDMYNRELSRHGLIVMGNEGNGVTAEVSSLINHRLYIPPYPQGRATSESLNVAVATAIVCVEVRRRM